MTGKMTVQWASRIRAAWQGIGDAMLAIGRLLVQAKEELPHGEFGRMIEQELPFGPDTAQRLMVLARDPRITAHARQLPASWMTRFELTYLSDEEFEDGIAEGVINPRMERKDATALRDAPGKPAERPPRLPSPEDALAQSEITGEAVQARDGRFYSHVEMQKRFSTDLVDGFCDFAESIVVNLSDPRLVELCDDPAVRERVRRHCERLAEECWKFANRLEAQAA